MVCACNKNNGGPSQQQCYSKVTSPRGGRVFHDQFHSMRVAGPLRAACTKKQTFERRREGCAVEWSYRGTAVHFERFLREAAREKANKSNRRGLRHEAGVAWCTLQLHLTVVGHGRALRVYLCWFSQHNQGGGGGGYRVHAGERSTSTKKFESPTCMGSFCRGTLPWVYVWNQQMWQPLRAITTFVLSGVRAVSGCL
jgi:hypothetical protein